MVNRTRCKWRATIDVNSVCLNSWLGRSNPGHFGPKNRGSGHRLNNGTGVIFGMIIFFRWPAIISK